MSSTAGTLEKAIKHHRSGGLREARRMYLRVLGGNPRNVDALHLLGVTSHQIGLHNEAEDAIRKAIALVPDRADFHNALGEVLATLERLPEAQSCFEEALRLRPTYAEALNNLGLIYQGQNQVVPALKCFHAAMRLRPDFAEPFNHAGILAFNQRQPRDAALFFQAATRIDPNYAAAFANLAIVHLADGQFAEAAQCSHEAIRINPRYASAHNNLGIVQQIHGQFEYALASFHKAIQFDPKSAQAHNNVGNSLRALGRRSEALNYYQKALQLDGHFADARSNLGQLLTEQGRHAEAVSVYEEALAQAPTDALKILSLLTLPVISESVEEVSRQRCRFEENLARLMKEKLVIDEPATQMSNLVFYLAYQGMNDRPIMADLASLYARATPSLNYTAPHCLVPTAPETDRRIRIGFISCNFYTHSVGRLNAGLIRQLSRERFHVTVFTFLARDDDQWRFLREGADAVVELPYRLAEARQKIADERLDALFYTDIGMDPWTYCLAHARLAPVQCTTWGHPVTTGIPTVDYYLSAHDLDPEDGDDHYTERLVRFDNLPSYFHRPPRHAIARTRRHFGLEEDAHLYLCPQSLFKLHPEFDALFDGILRADPLGRIVLVGGHSDHWMTLLMNRWRNTLGPRLQQIVVLPRQPLGEFLDLMALADAVLDPLHFGSGVSAYESFFVGSPVVTLPGRFLRNRIVYACYRRMGILDCVAADADDYIRIAVRLGNDAAWRADVRARILAANGVLFENSGIVRELEQFFLTAVRRASAAG